MATPGRGFHVEIDGMRQLRRDLRQIDRKLPAQLNRQIKQAAEPVRATAASLAPRSSISRPGYKHLADTLKVGTRGSRVVIYSRKPGANVIHWGGRHPLFGDRDHWYAQRPNPFITQAAARHSSRIERDIAREIERFMRRIGFH